MTKNSPVPDEYQDAVCMIVQGIMETDVHLHEFKKLDDLTIYCKNCGKMIKKDE